MLRQDNASPGGIETFPPQLHLDEIGYRAINVEDKSLYFVAGRLWSTLKDKRGQCIFFYCVVSQGFVLLIRSGTCEEVILE